MNFWACAFRISWSKMRHLPSLPCSLPDSFFLPVLKNFSETKEDQPWVFIGRTDVEAEIPMLWPPEVKVFHWKRPWCWERLRAGGEGKIPWTEEPGRLQSMGSKRVGHDWVTLLSLFTFMHWRRKWQSTPVFLPGESQGRWSLVGCCLWGHTQSDTTEVT